MSSIAFGTNNRPTAKKMGAELSVLQHQRVTGKKALGTAGGAMAANIANPIATKAKIMHADLESLNSIMLQWKSAASAIQTVRQFQEKKIDLAAQQLTYYSTTGSIDPAIQQRYDACVDAQYRTVLDDTGQGQMLTSTDTRDVALGAVPLQLQNVQGRIDYLLANTEAVRSQIFNALTSIVAGQAFGAIDAGRLAATGADAINEFGARLQWGNAVGGAAVNDMTAAVADTVLDSMINEYTHGGYVVGGVAQPAEPAKAAIATAIKERIQLGAAANADGALTTADVIPVINRFNTVMQESGRAIIDSLFPHRKNIPVWPAGSAAGVASAGPGYGRSFAMYGADQLFIGNNAVFQRSLPAHGDVAVLVDDGARVVNNVITIGSLEQTQLALAADKEIMLQLSNLMGSIALTTEMIEQCIFALQESSEDYTQLVEDIMSVDQAELMEAMKLAEMGQLNLVAVKNQEEQFYKQFSSLIAAETR